MRRRNPPTHDAAAHPLELFDRNFGAKFLASAPLKNSQAVSTSMRNIARQMTAEEIDQVAHYYEAQP
jgi:hypothetical protein